MVTDGAGAGAAERGSARTALAPGRYDSRRAVADARDSPTSRRGLRPAGQVPTPRVVGPLFLSPQGVGPESDPEERLA